MPRLVVFSRNSLDFIVCVLICSVYQEEQREQSQRGFFDSRTKKSTAEDGSAPLIVEDDVYPLAVITTMSFLALALSGGIRL